MDPVEEFADIMAAQIRKIEWYHEVDYGYRITDPERWPKQREDGRRGWTRQDTALAS